MAASRQITYGEDDARSVAGTTEAIVYEENVNFDDAAIQMLSVRLSAIVNRGAVVGTATFNLYVGATAPGNTAGGAIRASFSTTSATDEKQSNRGGEFGNPHGQQLVQITAVHSAALGIANIRGYEVRIG